MRNGLLGLRLHRGLLRGGYLRCKLSQLVFLAHACALLLINSIQSIDEPTGLITIAAEVESDTQEIILTFSDTGVGISDNDKQKIFDPFYTTKEVGEGTGLGLAVAYGILKKHKGSISVQNNKQKGTTFIITLPLS